MKPDVRKIRSVLTDRLRLDAIYLCGPLDSSGEPVSADIHILALAEAGGITDLHFVPGLSVFTRRVEVSVVPTGDAQTAVEEGVKTWLMFYTLDKIQRGRPIMESSRVAEIRRAMAQGLKLRPSFQAGIIRNTMGAAHFGIASLEAAGSEVEQSRPLAPGAVFSLLGANVLLLLSLSAYSITKLKQTYARHSELWLQVREQVSGQLEPQPPKSAEKTIRTAERFLRMVLGRYGIEPGAMPAYHLGRMPAED